MKKTDPPWKVNGLVKEKDLETESPVVHALSTSRAGLFRGPGPAQAVVLPHAHVFACHDFFDALPALPGTSFQGPGCPDGLDPGGRQRILVTLLRKERRMMMFHARRILLRINCVVTLRAGLKAFESYKR